MIVKEFDAQLTELDNVTAFVEGALEPFEPSMKVTMLIDVSLEEIFVNVAHYAYPNSSGKAIISVDVVNGVAIIEIKDNGVPFNPLAKVDPDVTLKAEDRDIGGLGIYMTKKSMDNVTYEYKDNQNILRMEKKIN